MKKQSLTLGQQLKKRRTDLKMTLKTLSERATISIRTIEKIEADSHKPSPAIRQALCEVLEIDISEIVTPIK